MYQPPQFAKKDLQFIADFIQAHPFAIMVSNGEKLIATHIPILLKEDATDLELFGHIANHNNQYNYLNDGEEVLLIFNGPHGYISSSWYNEADISTWNYAAVHVHATLKIQTEEELIDSLKKLVKRFEKDQEKPVLYDDLPEDMVRSHLKRITGFWLKPVKMEAISKMSQNKSEEDIFSVLDHLKTKKGATNLCNYMKEENEKKHS